MQEIPLANIFYMQHSRHSVSEKLSHRSRFRNIDELVTAIKAAQGDVEAVIVGEVEPDFRRS